MKIEYFFQISRCYLKNHCTNTRLVCTHLNAFSQWIQIWWWKSEFWKFFKKFHQFRLVVCTWHRVERVNKSTYSHDAAWFQPRYKSGSMVNSMGNISWTGILFHVLIYLKFIFWNIPLKILVSILESLDQFYLFVLKINVHAISKKVYDEL